MKQHQPKLEAEAYLLRNIIASGMERNIKAYWEISDENGQIVKGECKSLLKNFAYIMQSMFTAVNPTSTRDTGNTLRTLGIATRSATSFGIVSAAGVLVSGTGVGAISSDNYGMGTLYQTTGSALLVTDIDTANQLQYTMQQSIVATGTTTLNEMGFIAKIYDSTNVSRDILLIRDLISPGFATTLGVAYTMKVTLNWSVGENSYLTNFAKIWRGIMANQNETLRLYDNGGNFDCPLQSKITSSTIGIVSAPATILFGVSTTASTMDDFTLNRKLEESIASNSINIVNDTTKLQWQNYQAVSFINLYQFFIGYDIYDEPIYENFTPPYTIKEVGILLKTVNTGANLYHSLAVRCILPTGVVVPAGDGIMGKFTHEIAI